MAAQTMNRRGMNEDPAIGEARRAMIEDIERHFRATARVTGEAGMNERLREAMGRVPRHLFVPEWLRARAYADSALPIESGQTISQPFIVALSIELARVDADSRVLEIGTGSGYEAAVLAELTSEVYSIEIVRDLYESASQRLAQGGYDTVELRCDDGARGWPEAAPFDAIIVTACAPEVSAPLLEQLAPGGRLVAPVGPPYALQELQVHVKDERGHVRVEHELPVAFVPLVHCEARD